MKYNKKAFDAAVKQYKQVFKGFKLKNKAFMIIFNEDNEKAFLSLAPLSRAIHELGGDINTSGLSKDNTSIGIIFDAFSLYKGLRKGLKTKSTQVLKDFIKEGERKCNKCFSEMFHEPEYILEATKNGFLHVNSKKDLQLVVPYNTKWYSKYRWNDLRKTAKIIWKQLFNLKKGEKLSFNFDLIPAKKDLLMPLEDYLDSYAITLAMQTEARKYGKVSLGSGTQRYSQRAKANQVAELRNTLLGCHLSKDFKEPIFRKFKPLAKVLNTKRFRFTSAVFGINGRGYYGRHMFGEMFGYPTTDGKSRWHSPAQILFKLSFYPQTEHDSRKPVSRIGFTSTLPIDVFIKSSMINWMEMKRKDDILRKIFYKSSKIVVQANKSVKGYRSDFEVGLIRKDGTHRLALGSDVDIRDIIDKDLLRKKGIYGGNMANIPGGECFTTPEYVHGTIVGDVVINVDQSYPLSAKNPFVIKTHKTKGYRVITAPKQVFKKFNHRKKESWKRILEMEKHKSAPPSLIKMKKDRFNMIGEFAINTNPKAELCDYLIVNEKIAGMMHVAMGSGFEPDTSTEYHMDVVFNAPAQKIDVFGIDTKSGKKHWILKKGKSVLW